MTSVDIDNKLELFENIGGKFSFDEISNPQSYPVDKRIIEYLIRYQSRRDKNLSNSKGTINTYKKYIQGIKLIAIKDWKSLIKEKTHKWLRVDNPIAQKLSIEVLTDLFKYLDDQKIISSFFFETPLSLAYAPWGDDSSFDIVLSSQKKIFIYHCGWSY